VASVKFNEDPCVKEFGLSVSGDLQEVEAHVLNTPQLQYDIKGGEGNIVKPKGGVWSPKALFNTCSITKWIILNLDERTRNHDLWQFADGILDEEESVGAT
jgi:eukaryotic translation initiation factor 2C